MELIKKLIIYTKNPNNIEILDSAVASIDSVLFDTPSVQPKDNFQNSVLFYDRVYLKEFNIYTPKVYSFKTPELVKEYFKAVLQENHNYIFTVKQINGDLYQINLVVDGIEFHVHDNGLIVSIESGRSINVLSDLPRNNFKLYRILFPFLEIESKRHPVIQALTKMGYGKNHIEINEAQLNDEYGFKIQCYSSFEEKNGNDFEVFFCFKTSKFKFLNLLHPEAEYYSNGREPYTIEEIRFDIERLQNIAIKYKKIELDINSITL